MKIILTAILIVFIVHESTLAQKYTSKSTKAIRKFEDAISLFNVRRLDDAIIGLEAAIKEDDKFIEPYLMLADIYNMKRKYEKEAETFAKAIAINPEFYPASQMGLAKALYLSAQYKEGKTAIEKFLTRSDLKPEQKTDAELILKKCEFSLKAMENPVLFDPINLGDSINSEYDDYWPYLTADDQLLVFTRDISKRKSEFSFMRTGQEDIFVSKKVNGNYTKAKSIGAPINTEHNEGAECISANGLYFFFTGCGRIDGEGDCDIFFSKKTGGNWSKPINLGAPVNTSKWESTPSLSADGKSLYFATNRKGGKGKMDIWVATLSNDGGFNPPVNLGDSINTNEDEFAPYIHPDGKTLYFSSNGHIGLGGHDVYVSKKDSTGKWSKPVNVGYPINTNKDEIGMIVNSKGDMAMLASDRLGGKGCDIYSFDLYNKIKPVVTTYVKGTIRDAVTKKVLKARLELYNLKTQKMVAEALSDDQTGEYLVCLPTKNNYAFNVSHKGYLFYSENFALDEQKDASKPYQIDIELQPIEVDKKVVLKNIFYEFNSYELKPESKTELSELMDFLKTNPLVKIEIGGHTDNAGTKLYNQKLSENRAKSVYTYLTENGIQAERLSFKGYDFSQPVSTNETEEGRAMNRRTEFKIISIK